MATTTALNVWTMAANADTLALSFRIEAIRVVETGASTARIRLRQTDSNGIIIFDSGLLASGANVDSCACLKGGATIYLEVVSGAATVYLYSE